MNCLSSLSGACAPRHLALRASMAKSAFASSSSSSQLQQQQKQRIQPPRPRHLSTTSTSYAQPIQLTPSTATPEPPSSETSNLTADTLSRAPSDPTPPSFSSTTTAPTSTTNPTPTSPKLHIGTVSRTGTMTHAVQITSRVQTFDKFLQKHYTRPKRLLAHDPNPAGFLREGDVVEYSGYNEIEEAERERKRKGLEDRLIGQGKIRLTTNKGKVLSLRDVGVKKSNSRWVVRRVVTPFGTPVELR